ncbi:hypothetical protein TSMEX_010979 [Taenia solium]|eukprot:TsM_001171100 transcript=TsM_001171100 gene=TsM_001171100
MWWRPPLTPDVLDFCPNLHHLQQFQEALLHAICTPATHAYGIPGGKSGIDIMGPLPLTKRRNIHILVMVDYFTKVAEAEPMKPQDAESVASTFFKRWICQHGVLESVHNDQGPNHKTDFLLTNARLSEWQRRARQQSTHREQLTSRKNESHYGSTTEG